jgi:hypothetical protein
MLLAFLSMNAIAPASAQIVKSTLPCAANVTGEPYCFTLQRDGEIDILGRLRFNAPSAGLIIVSVNGYARCSVLNPKTSGQSFTQLNTQLMELRPPIPAPHGGDPGYKRHLFFFGSPGPNTNVTYAAINLDTSRTFQITGQGVRSYGLMMQLETAAGSAESLACQVHGGDMIGTFYPRKR